MSESHSQADKNEEAELQDILEQRAMDPTLMKIELEKLKKDKQELEEDIKQEQ